MNEYTDKYMQLFINDERFRHYVIEYCRKHKIKAEAAFDHVIVRAAGDYYLSKGVSKK